MKFIYLQRLYNFLDMMQSMNGIVCWYNLLFRKILWPKKSYLIILNNFGHKLCANVVIRVLFFVYRKIAQILEAPTTWLQSSHVNVVKGKMWRQKKQFFMFYFNKYYFHPRFFNFHSMFQKDYFHWVLRDNARKIGKSGEPCCICNCMSFSRSCVLSDRPPVVRWLSPEEGRDTVTRFDVVSCKKGATTKTLGAVVKYMGERVYVGWLGVYYWLDMTTLYW